MMVLNLLGGITKTETYEAISVSNGEIRFILNTSLFLYTKDVTIIARINSHERFMLFCIAVETIAQYHLNTRIHAHLYYMPYQQSDRDFENGECFALKTITKILNNLPVISYVIADAHSDVTPALLNNKIIQDNSQLVRGALKWLRLINKESDWTIKNNLTLLTPDAGAYKKVYKLIEGIDFEGNVESANKFRNREGLQLNISTQDFNSKDILIIDDICLGGRTFTELAQAIDNKNIGRRYLVVTHGIFDHGFKELAKYFDCIFTTDSWQSVAQFKAKLSDDGFSEDSLGTFLQVHPLFGDK